MYVNDGGSSQVSKLPDFLVTAKNAATKRLENLKTDANSIFNDIKYADGKLSELDLNKAIEIFSAETLKAYDDMGFGKKDGKTTVDEYIAAQTDIAVKNHEAMLKELGAGRASDEEIGMFKRQNELLAKNMDVNEDGLISVEEQALLNKTADSIDGKFDGTITATAENAVSTNVTGMDAENPEDPTNLSYRYIMGENLTTEELQQLQANTKAIHNGIASTASTYGVDLSVNTTSYESVTEQASAPKNNEVAQSPKKVTIQKWGSKAENGQKYANDSLSRIVANNYTGVKLYSKEYNEIINKIVEVNGLKTPNHISAGKELILPEA